MTKGIIRYLLFLLILFLLTLLLDSYPIYILMIAFGAAGIAMVPVGYFIARKLEVVLQPEAPSVELGDAIRLAVSVKNEGVLPASFIYGELIMKNDYYGSESREEIVLQSAGRSSAASIISIDSEHLGSICVEPGSFYVCDPFRIWKFKVKTGAAVRVPVLPSKRTLMEQSTRAYANELDPAEGESYSKTKSGSDVSELFGIREYRAGDSQRQIYQKLSLKMGTLMVKEFGQPENRVVKLLVELADCGDEEETFAKFDSVVTELMSVGEELCDRGVTYEVIWYDSASEGFVTVRASNEAGLMEAINSIYVSTPVAMETSVVTQYRNYINEVTGEDGEILQLYCIDGSPCTD